MDESSADDGAMFRFWLFILLVKRHYNLDDADDVRQAVADFESLQP